MKAAKLMLLKVNPTTMGKGGKTGFGGHSILSGLGFCLDVVVVVVVEVVVEVVVVVVVVVVVELEVGRVVEVVVVVVVVGFWTFSQLLLSKLSTVTSQVSNCSESGPAQIADCSSRCV